MLSIILTSFLPSLTPLIGWGGWSVKSLKTGSQVTPLQSCFGGLTPYLEYRSIWHNHTRMLYNLQNKAWPVSGSLETTGASIGEESEGSSSWPGEPPPNSRSIWLRSQEVYETKRACSSELENQWSEALLFTETRVLVHSCWGNRGPLFLSPALPA